MDKARLIIDESTPLVLLSGAASDRSDENESEKAPPPFNLYEEADNLIRFALPTVFVQFCIFLIYPQCASAVGRELNTQSLAAFSLGSLSGNMTCVSIIIGILTASETLQPRAFGLKRYREVGRLAIRGFFMCILTLIVPVVIFLTRANDFFHWVGQDADVGNLASEWIRIYIWGVLPVLLFRVTQRWLACQNIVLPCVVASGIGSFVVHPIVLKWAITRFGFIGSTWAIVISQTAMLLLLIGYILLVPGSYVRSTWPELSPSFIWESLDARDLIDFAKLSVGGVFSLCEWWFWESICFLAGEFGLVELCVHTVIYQLIPISFMVPLGISIGLSVRLGNLLPINVNGAKRLAAVTMIFTIISAILVSLAIYKYQAWIVSMFTADEEVIEGCQRIWFLMCIWTILLWYFGVSKGILNALGLQWKIAANSFVILWVVAIPAIIYSCIYCEKGYYHMWKMLPLSYTVLNIGLTITFTSANWEEIGTRIRLERNL